MPTLPLTQQHLLTDTKLGSMLGEGKGWGAVAQSDTDFDPNFMYDV